MSKSKTQTYANVWDALAETPEEAANLRVRSELMSKIASALAALIEENHWTQAEAAGRCGVTQPRINDLLRGRISRFSIDGLINIAAAIGLAVHLKLDATSSSVSRGGKYVARATRRRRRNRRFAGGSRTSRSTIP